VPDVTAIPFVTTLKPFVTNPATGLPVTAGGQRVPLLGPSGPLPETAFVTLAASTLLAQGIGIPAVLGGRGTALPDEVILDPAEVAVIREHLDANNAAIREICSAAGVPLLDVRTLLQEIATSGRRIGGVTVTGAFLTGGFFSYDGVHPTDLGYALLANEWIRVIDGAGGSLSPVDLGPYLGVASASSVGAGAAAREAPVEFSEDAYRALLSLFPPIGR
jgi:hypothetical protein